MSVLVDTSVWVDHFRNSNDELTLLLSSGQVLCHPLVVGEIACGSPPKRLQTIVDLQKLETTQSASLKEAMALIENQRLFGLGCGLIDLLLLASTMLTPDAKLCTLDRNLSKLARRFEVSYVVKKH